MTAGRLRPADVAVLRSVYLGHVRWAFPVRVLEETETRVALYLAPGTRGKRFAGPPLNAVADLRDVDWSLEDAVWRYTHRLYLTPFGRAHSLELFWDAETWAFAGWYVNLQEPLRRTPVGFDTRDQALDVVIAPDGSWSWKDEDHLESAVRNGRFTAEEARAVRREGERVVARLGDLLPTGWEDWRPPASWPVPELPPLWDA